MTKTALLNFDKIQTIINCSKSEFRNTLSEVESKKILSHVGISAPTIEIAYSEMEALELSKEINFPVVLKIVSPQITHKSDAKCVMINLKDEVAVKQAYRQIILNAKQYNSDADITGVSVQPHLQSGMEVIVGMKRDSIFGPVILFGLGGIFVEIIKDFSLRVLPLSDIDIEEMVKEIKGYPMLKGFRGENKKDISAIQTIIKKIAHLSNEFQEIKEIDLNPIFLYKDNRGASVVDARIIIE